MNVRLHESLDPDALVAGLQQEGPVVFLESQCRRHPASRYNFLAARPRKIYTAEKGVLWVEEHGKKKKLPGNIWEQLEKELEPAGNWYFGYLGYDLKNSLEDLSSQNPDRICAPDLFLMVPELVLKIDQQVQTMEMLKGSLNAEEWGGKVPESEISLGNITYSVSREEYEKAVQKAQTYIKEGDLYELNIAHQSVAGFHGNPFELYRRMRRYGPVPFGAYLRYKDLHICCESPERFLAKRGRKVFSQPIKGTSKRGYSPYEDEQLRSRLLNSVKEQAENLMIVDLVRHDLNKIARKGTVKVPALFDLQTFSTVHQLVSTIVAETRYENPIKIIKACFPMGSMTGAPKIRAMKRIDELETFRRGIYSGAIGYITPEHDFDFNVVIRTALVKNNNVYYAAGGAITSDSDIEEEWQETLLKKQALSKIIEPLSSE